MAIKGVMDFIAPSPEKVLENNLREDERKLDQQKNELELLKSQMQALAAK